MTPRNTQFLLEKVHVKKIVNGQSYCTLVSNVPCWQMLLSIEKYKIAARKIQNESLKNG